MGYEEIYWSEDYYKYAIMVSEKESESESKRESENNEKGEKDGWFQSWYENGQVHEKGEYKEDLKNGEWTEYAEDGSIISSEKYQKGKLLETNDVGIPAILQQKDTFTKDYGIPETGPAILDKSILNLKQGTDMANTPNDVAMLGALASKRSR